jgi:hypothetical protein
MRKVSDLFVDEIDRPLYHYTGIGSLLGIAKTKSLWASNVYYLNDSEEIIYACDILDEVLAPRIAFGDYPQTKDFLVQLQAWVGWFRTHTYNLFGFSLSEERSLLSQWRSYTPHGKGVSIGFFPETLNRMLKNCNVKLVKCIYERKDQEELINDLINLLIATFEKNVSEIDVSKEHPSQCYHAFLEGYRGDVLQVLSMIKHGAFKEEQEWRLISSYYPVYTLPEVRFREGASMLVPYLELSLGENKPYFAEVILGPSQHGNLSTSALSMFLSNQQLSNRTGPCGIPYREW